MEELLSIAQRILHEEQTNKTLVESWRPGMRVAVDYILDRIYDTMLNDFIAEKGAEFEYRGEDPKEHFDSMIGYDVNSTTGKRFEILSEHFYNLK